MYNPAVTQAFTFSAADSQRYGVSKPGLLSATPAWWPSRFWPPTRAPASSRSAFGSWDMHVDIYGLQNPNGNNMFTLGPQLDDGVSALIDDLKASRPVRRAR